MGEHSPPRILVIVVSAIIFVITIVFNALAVSGRAPFLQSTGNVSHKYSTEITPSGWTFSIWAIIYTWLSAILVYIFSGLCRRNPYGWMYCSPAVLPYGFFLSWIWNMFFNISWLLLWDREQLIACLVVLALLTFTNYLVVFFCSHGLHVYDAWLGRHHKVDLWMLRLLVQNGVAVYATWTTIATLLNLAVVLQHSAGMSESAAGSVPLSILLMDFVAWMTMEQAVVPGYVSYVFTVYPVAIVALVGSLTKNYEAASPSVNSLFTVVLLALACLLFAVRLVIFWKCRKAPIYQDANAVAPLSLEDIAQKQRFLCI